MKTLNCMDLTQHEVEALSKSALKNKGMSLRVERSGTKQSQGFQ